LTLVTENQEFDKEERIKKILESTEIYEKYKYLTPDKGSQRNLTAKNDMANMKKKSH